MNEKENYELVRFVDGELELEVSVSPKEDTVWLTQKQMAVKKYKTKLYNLDMIISVGYRVKSKRGIYFRQWANKILKEYLLKGYVINKERTLVTNENYIRLINKAESFDERVSNIENNYNHYELKILKYSLMESFMMLTHLFNKYLKVLIMRL